MERVDVVEVDQPIVVQFVNRILADAVQRGATAIRFRVSREPLPDEDPAQVPAPPARVDVHYFVESEYVPVDSIRIQFYSQIANRIRIMASLDYWKMQKRQTGQIDVTIDGIPLMMSVSIEKVDKDEEIVIGIARES